MKHSVGDDRGGSNPLAVVAEEHALQLELCNVLEAIADGLPDCVDRRLVRVAVSILEGGFGQHMKMEDELLFPLLRRAAPADVRLHGMLQQLEREHQRDEGFALEIQEELSSLVERGAARNPEMLGYMLRGFFEGQRRHVEWENATILPLATEVLTAADLAELRTRLTQHRRPGCTCASLRRLRRAVAGNRGVDSTGNGEGPE